MDPLSLGASIAGLISVVDLVITRGTKFYCSVRDAPKEISTLIGETMALMGILTNLKTFVMQQMSGETGNVVGSRDSTSLMKYLVQDTTNSSQPYAKQSSDIVVDKKEPVLIHNCHEALKSVLDLLSQMESCPDEPVKNTVKRLRWHFAENKVKGLLAKIERHKNSFQLAMSVNNL
jgi:hypothetical protein